jgi:hypothetical protein
MPLMRFGTVPATAGIWPADRNLTGPCSRCILQRPPPSLPAPRAGKHGLARCRRDKPTRHMTERRNRASAPIRANFQAQRQLLSSSGLARGPSGPQALGGGYWWQWRPLLDRSAFAERWVLGTSPRMRKRAPRSKIERFPAGTLMPKHCCGMIASATRLASSSIALPNRREADKR